MAKRCPRRRRRAGRDRAQTSRRDRRRGSGQRASRCAAPGSSRRTARACARTRRDPAYAASARRARLAPGRRRPAQPSRCSPERAWNRGNSAGDRDRFRLHLRILLRCRAGRRYCATSRRRAQRSTARRPHRRDSERACRSRRAPYRRRRGSLREKDSRSAVSRPRGVPPPRASPSARPCSSPESNTPGRRDRCATAMARKAARRECAASDAPALPSARRPPSRAGPSCG